MAGTNTVTTMIMTMITITTTIMIMNRGMIMLTHMGIPTS